MPSESSIVEIEEPNKDNSSVDINNNGMVTIKEAKDARFSMPITKDHWLYFYMRDNGGMEWSENKKVDTIMLSILSKNWLA